jgi:hypothetical protein
MNASARFRLDYRRDYASSNSGWSGRVAIVRSVAALNLLTLANAIVILTTVQLNAARRHVAARTNAILTLLFRVRPHTSSGGHLFRAMPSDIHERLWTIGIR